MNGRDCTVLFMFLLHLHPAPLPIPRGNCGSAGMKILAKWKENADKFERERQKECPGSGLGGQIKCKVKTNIAAQLEEKL